MLLRAKIMRYYYVLVSTFQLKDFKKLCVD